MRLDELFNQDNNDDGDKRDLRGQMNQAALDMLTPLVANNVPFVTVNQVTAELRKTRPGIAIDRSYVMELLDPTVFKCVKKIEGDRIYLQQPEYSNREVDDTQAEDDIDKVKSKAKAQAQKSVADDSAAFPS